jgi:hypothetical protein
MKRPFASIDQYENFHDQIGAPPVQQAEEAQECLHDQLVVWHQQWDLQCRL